MPPHAGWRGGGVPDGDRLGGGSGWSRGGRDVRSRRLPGIEFLLAGIVALPEICLLGGERSDGAADSDSTLPSSMPTIFTRKWSPASARGSCRSAGSRGHWAKQAPRTVAAPGPHKARRAPKRTPLPGGGRQSRPGAGWPSACRHHENPAGNPQEKTLPFVHDLQLWQNYNSSQRA